MAKSENIIFAGQRSDVYDIISACDVTAVPSLSEAFGRVIIEAMACGKPVVGSNVGGIPEIIEDGRTGILVQPKDEKALADALGSLISDRDLARSMGNSGKLRAERSFNIHGQVKEIEKVIDENIKE
jgi:glycosyltransferase involved in cell wall biosynthesis